MIDSQDMTLNAEQTDSAQEKRIYASKEEVLERVKTLAQGEEEITKPELDHLKTAFYFLLNAEREAAQKAYIADGGDPMQYVVTPDETEEAFKAEMSKIKEIRQAAFQKAEAEKQANLSGAKLRLCRLRMPASCGTTTSCARSSSMTC